MQTNVTASANQSRELSQVTLKFQASLFTNRNGGFQSPPAGHFWNASLSSSFKNNKIVLQGCHSNVSSSMSGFPDRKCCSVAGVLPEQVGSLRLLFLLPAPLVGVSSWNKDQQIIDYRSVISLSDLVC